MERPKFLLCDNSNFPDKSFVLHTEFPMFLVDIITDEVDWLDEIDLDEEDLDENHLETLVTEAFDFFDSEYRDIE